MTNVEIKARCENTERVEESLRSLGAGPAGTFDQIDTYFRVSAGRLKLRELSADEGYLVYYEREDARGPTRSDYEIAATTDPQGMREMLGKVLGVWVTVEKRRQIWLWENVRIHLDEVKGVGRFVELEAISEELSLEESERRLQVLMRALEISEEQLVDVSYSDLVAAAHDQPAVHQQRISKTR